MAMAHTLCFSAICGLAVLAADYAEQTRKAGLPLGQFPPQDYATVVINRLTALEKPDTMSLKNLADLWGRKDPEQEGQTGVTMIQVQGRQPTNGSIRVSRGLSGGSGKARGCVRRGTVLSC